LEDFFTELVAYLFSVNKEILYAWLKDLSLLDTNAALESYVSTQTEFKPLAGHHSGSRPDILIELVGDQSRTIIFIESKIGSQEGDQQLFRYAEILHNLSDYQQKYLLYITRDFDPKNEVDILRRVPKPTGVQFKQLRWHQFHRFLQSHAETMLAQEMITFMNEYNMAHNNQFSSIDVIALANFTKSLKLMEETMWGEVSQRFKQVLGDIKQKSTAMTQLQVHGRYLMTMGMPSGWWCGLGFYLRTSTLTDYPTVCLMLEVDPNSPRRAEIIEAMNDICTQHGWKGCGLNDTKTWSSIVRERSLQDFLAKEDHIAAVQQFFLESLNQLQKIKDEYPNLPWLAIGGNGKGADDLPLITQSSGAID
ncbi:MAG TPA: PD-(D/E)XK nuclease family protein, partial [Allocoleopsis sp.]